MGTFFCGVDIGASATKLVLLEENSDELARVVMRSGTDYAATARDCLQQATADAGLSGAPSVAVATGYGRQNVDFADSTRTEIHCHGVGCYHQFPRAITIVDIGGQDNKIIHLDSAGRRQNFLMNRKCAAGTGAFVEEIAQRLGLKLEDMDALAAAAEQGVKLSSFCTVFAKTEILSHLRRGVPAGDIVRGAFMSVIARIAEMDPLQGDVVATGGVVAHNPTIVRVLADRLGRAVTVPEAPQFTGALGAALTASSLTDDQES